MSAVAELTIFPINESVDLEIFNHQIKKELDNLLVENTHTATGITIKTKEMYEVFEVVNRVMQLQKEKHKKYFINIKILLNNEVKNLTLGS